ncbi:aminotransferase class I/II-fold pyridoxal phosphate-dependent enzyme, partial [Lutimonas sp.]|uniref:aminotransferase class I/II-fold pyridoxal phosphate-dependent enzyme n=1 Tax=Lutimonas sp. TaxID=1872403 RepID=UPI003C73EB59
MKFPSKLLDKLEGRRLSGSLRSLPAQTDLIDFSSNDYLGFSRNEHLFDQVMKKLKTGQAQNGSTGSRLLSGNFAFHEALEAELAEFFKADGALLFNSGYDANIGLLSSVPQRGDRIFYDEFSHASIRDGIRLSHAKAFGFRHNDLDDLQQKIKATDSEGEVYVVVESVYSMDGDQAPLRELSQLSEPLNFKLIVDEAHATGVYGLK